MIIVNRCRITVSLIRGVLVHYHCYTFKSESVIPTLT